MTSEFNLSEKKYDVIELARKLSYNPIIRYKSQNDVYLWVQEIVDLALQKRDEDVKEFIRRLKEEVRRLDMYEGLFCGEEGEKMREIIDKLAGSKLI